MSYTNGLDKPTDYFNTKLYTGNGSSSHAITGVGFQPDWVWIKRRNDADSHFIYDSVRFDGSNAYWLQANNTNAQGSDRPLTAFGSDGFTIGSNNSGLNANSSTYVSWNWKAGGTAPAITYTVKVVSDSGNKYRFNDFGTSAVTLDLQEGGTYTFDQSDSSNSGHPLRFSTTSNGSHGGGSEYTTGVTVTGTPGNAGAKTVITVGSGVATLYYYCTQHSAMGGQANTNSGFGSSNFSGSIQSLVSASTDSGFSIVKWTADGSNNNAVGHGLGVTPKIVIYKKLTGSNEWYIRLNFIDGSNDYLILNKTNAKSNDSTDYPAPTSTLMTSYGYGNGDSLFAYCFAEKKGYSKINTYTGNGNAEGTFVYTGFKPAWVLRKRADSSANWTIFDNKRDTFNLADAKIKPNENEAENDHSSNGVDFLSNGFKNRTTDTEFNASGGTYIYMAFAESPFVSSTGIPTTAR